MQKLLGLYDGGLGCRRGGRCRFVPEKLSLKLLLFDISFQLPLDPRIRAQGIVHDEVVQDLHPRCVLRQVIIILCCYFLHLETNRKQKKQTLPLEERADFREPISVSTADKCRHV